MSDLAAVRLRQRVLRNVDAVTTSTRILGQEWTLPVALGPVGLSGMCARRGAARPLWFQLSIICDEHRNFKRPQQDL